MRVCEWCSKPIGDERKTTAKTCSDQCRDARRRAYGIAYAQARYEKRPALAERPCERCGELFTPHTKVNRFCSRRCNWSATTIASVPRTRPCSRCGCETPTRPGRAVCTGCRADPRIRSNDHERRRRLKTYGLTQDQYDVLLARQGGHCEVCGTDQPGGKKTWAIDHCHETGFVRGLLCTRCNLAIGQMEDDPDLLRKAARYIERASEMAVA